MFADNLGVLVAPTGIPDQQVDGFRHLPAGRLRRRSRANWATRRLSDPPPSRLSDMRIWPRLYPDRPFHPSGRAEPSGAYRHPQVLAGGPGEVNRDRRRHPEMNGKRAPRLGPRKALRPHRACGSSVTDSRSLHHPDSLPGRRARPCRPPSRPKPDSFTPPNGRRRDRTCCRCWPQTTPCLPGGRPSTGSGTPWRSTPPRPVRRECCWPVSTASDGCAEGEDRQHRSEDLLPGDAVGLGDIGEERGREPESRGAGSWHGGW